MTFIVLNRRTADSGFSAKRDKESVPFNRLHFKRDRNIFTTTVQCKHFFFYFQPDTGERQDCIPLYKI